MYPYPYASWPMPHTDFSINLAPLQPDPSNRESGETARSQYLPRAQAQQQLGHGPPPASMHHPSIAGIANSSLAPGPRSNSLPDQAFATRTSVPDIGAMLAAISLQQNRHAGQNQVLAEQNQALAAQNTTLQSRVDALELVALRAPDSDAPQIDSRMAAALRKKKAKTIRRREKANEGMINTDTQPSENDPVAPLSRASDLTGNYLGDKTLSTPQAIEARRILSTQTFREVCSVSSKEAWPDPHLIRLNETTGERYPTPNFDAPVTDSGNSRLIGLIAQRMDQGLQASRADSGATWDLRFLRELAKKSFGNLKPGWRRQTNPQVAARAQLEGRSNRRRQHRILKVTQKTSVLRAFAAQHGVDPEALARLLHEQYESDEESGPEDDSDESKDAWKMRMASSCGITVTSRSALAELDFVEVLAPEWRSDVLSNVYHALHKYWFSTLNARERKQITYLRARTTRTSTRIPDVAPWNIAISIPWLEANRLLPDNTLFLADWNAHGNPSGLDSTFFDKFRDTQVDGNEDEPDWYVADITRLAASTSASRD
ncbi:hypothetical protein K438DRAFT_2008930 [Mycena galopus ATCC 62051]|nr:hypothetical protein K438DRAFT_2008930 [Mycena galopus ATCC 62051]